MKTTVDIADHLLVAAKQRAAAERRSLRDIIECGLRLVLEARTPLKRRKSIRWVTAPGGVAQDVADRAAMHAWVRAPPE